MYVNSNSKTLKFQRRDVISEYDFLLSILNAFLLELKSITQKCDNVNDTKGVEILYHDCSILLRLEVPNQKYRLI